MRDDRADLAVHRLAGCLIDQPGGSLLQQTGNLIRVSAIHLSMLAELGDVGLGPPGR